MIELSNTQFSLGILPEVGASIAYLQRHIGQQVVPILCESSPVIRQSHDLAGLIAAPWTSYLGQRGITVEGVFYPLESSDQHGIAWQSEWDVVSANQTHVSLVLDSAEVPPFDYSVTLDYQLHDHSLEMRVALTHLGEHATPYGLGSQFCFVAPQGTQLKLPAQAVSLNTIEQLPEAWQTIATDDENIFNFNQLRTLPTTMIRHQFKQEHGQAVLKWPAQLGEMRLQQTQSPYATIDYQPEGEKIYIALMSHQVNAFHHISPKEEGLVWLRHGQTMAFRTILSIS